MKEVKTLEQGIEELKPLKKGEWLEVAEYPVHGVQVLLQVRRGVPRSLELDDYGDDIVLREYKTSEDAKKYEDECKNILAAKGYSYKNQKEG